MNSKKRIMFISVSLLFLMILPIRTFVYSNSFITDIIGNTIYQGNGTEEDPYLIYNEIDLRRIGNDENWTLDKSYKLMVNISLEKPPEGESNWVPIGTSVNPFKGTFDGNNKTIKNMTIVDFDSNYVGLFGRINNGKGAKVENLGLLDIYIKSNFTAGGLAGVAIVSTIRNCYTIGDILIEGNKPSVGGLVGIAVGTIDRCYSHVNVYSNGYRSYSGGIVGTLYGKIRNSYSTGFILGYEVGGIIGSTFEKAEIENCYSLSVIESSTTGITEGLDGIIGGIAGAGEDVVIKNCYFAGTLIVDFGDIAGCIMGESNNSTIQNCVVACDIEIMEYNSTLFSNPTFSHIIYSDSNGKVILENNYILEDIYLKAKDDSNKANYISDKNSFTGSVRSRLELTNQSFYESIGWNFSEDNPIWEFRVDYKLPTLIGVRGQENLVTPLHLQ